MEDAVIYSYVHTPGARCIMMAEGQAVLVAEDPKGVTCPVCILAKITLPT